MMGKRRAALARMERVIKRTKAKQITLAQAPVEQASSRFDRVRVEPAVDYRLVYETHLKLTRGNYPGDSEEPSLRAIERAVFVFRDNHHNANLEDAKAAVLAAIAKAKERA